MPIYNVEDYIEDTLKNMVNQTFIDNIEVLMIDDGSTDNSRYIIEKYALDYDNFYAFHKKNEGQCVARNLALLFARGEYIHFMDSDDFITFDAYEKLYKIAKTENYDVVTFNYLRFDEERTWKVASQLDVFDMTTGNIENTNLTEFKELSWDMTNCNKLVKKELLDRYDITYYYKNIIYEDNLFWIEVYSNAKKMAVIKDYMYFWRYRENLTSTTQNRDLDLGLRFEEMVNIVNEFITQNITDEMVLNKKYEKLLTINLYFLMKDITGYPKEDHEYLFESVYNMFSLVPDKYFENLNSYFKVIYKMVENKQWVMLSEFLSYNFKKNPILIDSFAQYNNELDFKKDSYSERLDSVATNIYINENDLIIEFYNSVPYNLEGNFDKILFRLLNDNFDEILLDSNFIEKNKLIIPLDLLNFGVNRIVTMYYYDGILKESYMRTSFDKSFFYNDFYINIKRGTAEHLKLIRFERNDIKLIINKVEFDSTKLKFHGNSNKKISTIIINDYLGIVNLEFPVNYISEDEFYFEINNVDFLKAPIRKWEVRSNEVFDSIKLSSEFEFIDNNYIIEIKNLNNTFYVEFKLYNSLTKINDLVMQNNNLNKLNNNLMQINNKLNSLLPSTYDSNNELWIDVNNSKNISSYSMFNEKDGELQSINNFKQLTIKNQNPSVVRVFSEVFNGDFEATLEIKVSDYANIGLSNPDDVVHFAFIRISNNDWVHYRFIRINGIITSYYSDDGINWDQINLTGNTLDSDDCQFQFNGGFSEASDKKIMVRNIQIYRI